MSFFINEDKNTTSTEIKLKSNKVNIEISTKNEGNDISFSTTSNFLRPCLATILHSKKDSVLNKKEACSTLGLHGMTYSIKVDYAH